MDRDHEREEARQKAKAERMKGIDKDEWFNAITKAQKACGYATEKKE